TRSERLAQALIARPELLDELGDATAGPRRSAAVLRRAFLERAAREPDDLDPGDRLRLFKQAEEIRIAWQDLVGGLSVPRVGWALTELAAACLGLAWEWAEAQVAGEGPRPPGARLHAAAARDGAAPPGPHADGAGARAGGPGAHPPQVRPRRADRHRVPRAGPPARPRGPPPRPPDRLDAWRARAARSAGPPPGRPGAGPRRVVRFRARAPPLAPAGPGAAARLSAPDWPGAGPPRPGRGPAERGRPRPPPSRGGRIRAGRVRSGRRELSVPTFYLVDGPSYLYRAYHAIAHLSTSRGLSTNATLGLTMMLWKLLREDRPDYMGIAWDAKGP